MADMGHVGENLYLGCAALGLGTCGIGAYDQKLCDSTFQLDGEEEFTLYTQTVGTIRPEDGGAEKDFLQVRGGAGALGPWPDRTGKSLHKGRSGILGAVFPGLVLYGADGIAAGSKKRGFAAAKRFLAS